jgi:NAD(P)-dependent dehydrogenase (short-subunit alcohol dehydrogenase family)
VHLPGLERRSHKRWRPGATLHLSGRDRLLLEAVAASCRGRGATVESKVLDVRHAEAMAAWIGADLVIANAGISGRSREGGSENEAQTRAIFDVNLGGVLNAVLPAMGLMALQRSGVDGIRGRIVAIASIAAFMAAPDSPAYCASKAAVDRWMVATAPAARRNGIVLTSVRPGFISTAMTAGYQFPCLG